MKIFYKILIIAFAFVSSSAFSQAYVKFEETPPMTIKQKSEFVNGFKIKYNIPEAGFLYLTLFKDGKPIGNSVKKVTRGKRSITTNIFMWKKGENLTRKGEYLYRLQVYKGPENDFSTLIAKAPVVEGVTVVKKL